MRPDKLERDFKAYEKLISVQILSVKSLEELGKIKNSALGKTGFLGKYFDSMMSYDPSDRKEIGQLLNITKKKWEELFTRAEDGLIKNTLIKEDSHYDIDITAPKHTSGLFPELLPLNGALHPLQEEVFRMIDIFSSMGFEVHEGRELDNDYYVFDSLGMPLNHPARQNWDTFRTEGNFIPTPHTSNMQVRVMRQAKTVPIRSVIYGKCFRNEAVDAVHSHTFYQIEGIYVDKGISIAHMIGTIVTYLEAFFEQEIVWKIQPGYFPFVEPGIEVQIKCVFCKGAGCASCKHTGWLEVIGAGMIHPVVLREARLDPKEYSGFAWGLGLDRLVMQKHGITDIRSIYNSDIRSFTAL